MDHFLYSALGKTNEARKAAYRALFKAHLSQAGISEIREATNKAWVLGSNRFKEEIAATVRRRVQSLPKGRPRKQVE